MSTKNTIPLASVQADCQQCSFKSMCLPQSLVGFQAHMFENIVQQLPSIEGKKRIYKQGDKIASLYFVRSGCVKRIHRSEYGMEQIIGFSLPGELLGMDAIATGRYNETAITLDATSVCMLEYSRFEELCEKIPNLAKQILKMAGKELIKEHDLRLAIASKNVEERLAMFFSNILTRLQLLGHPPNEFILLMKRDDIADYLGMKYETVSRTITKLAKRGLIEVDRKSVKIKDFGGLKALAGHCNVCPSLAVSNSG